MQYTTGTYIIRTAKLWQCEGCKEDILTGIKCFVKIKEYGKILINQNGEEYKHKNCIRYHIKCAEKLDNLSEYEKKLLIDFNPNGLTYERKSRKSIYLDKEYKYTSSEYHLRMAIHQVLLKYENKHQLTFLTTRAGLYKDIKTDNVYQIGRKGFSDFIIFFPDQKTYFIELKCLKKRYLNNNQKVFKEDIEKLGYSYYIISTPKELDNIINNIL